MASWENDNMLISLKEQRYDNDSDLVFKAIINKLKNKDFTIDNIKKDPDNDSHGSADIITDCSFSNKRRIEVDWYSGFYYPLAASILGINIFRTDVPKNDPLYVERSHSYARFCLDDDCTGDEFKAYINLGNALSAAVKHVK